MKMLLRRLAAIMLSAAMLLGMTPAAAFGAELTQSAASGRGNSHIAGKGTDGNDAQKYVSGQAVVLYEDNAVDTSAPSGSRAKRAARKAPRAAEFGASAASEGSGAVAEAENTLGQQAEILDEAIGGDYVIEDTVVLETEGDDPDKIISVISSDSLDTDDLVSKLEASDDISIAEPNYIYHASAIPDWNDTYLKDSWQLYGDNGINADTLWNNEDYQQAESSSDPVVVAVVDTGIDYYQPDLSGHMWTKPKSKAFTQIKGLHGYDFVYGSDDPMDEYGHGTHCAGIIAGAGNNGSGIVGVSGASDKVQLLAVRVLDEDGAGTLEDIVAAFRYIIRLKKAGANIRVINCSLGASATSDIFDEIIDQAGEAGILTIAAAGNEAADNDLVPSSPANSKSDYVVSVGALDEDGSYASYSNYGKRNVDLAAPGSNVLSTVSYENYAPYLYDNDTIRKTTEYYGEFGDAEIEKAVNAQGEEIDTVKPVLGTDYNGNEVTDVGEFGSSVMLTNRVRGSKGRSTLELTDKNGFNIGNNQTSLRWNITGASEGDQYILYFPYEKDAGDSEQISMNLAFRMHTDEDKGGSGTLDVGDIKINGIDKKGRADWSTLVSDYEGFYQMDVSPDWNSIWQASGATNVFYPYSSIRGYDNNVITTSGASAAVPDVSSDENSEDEKAAESPKIASNNDAATEAAEAFDSDDETSAALDAEGQNAGTSDTGIEATTSDAESEDETTSSDNEDIQEDQATQTAGSDSVSAKSAGDTGNADAGSDEGTNTDAADAQNDSNTDAADPDNSSVTATPQDATGYGLGMVYQAQTDGDIYIDISSAGISKAYSEMDDNSFGRYDVYSGTSMATPVVTGSAAMLALASPDMSAADLKSTLFSAVRDGYEGWCSTGGAIDLSAYKPATENIKPAISGAIADFDKKTVTLKGTGFGVTPVVTVRNNISGAEEKIPGNDIHTADGSIVISNADAGGHAIIGSDITFTVENAGMKGQGTFYVVNGLKKYDAGYEFDIQHNDSFDLFDKSSTTAGSTAETIYDDNPEESVGETAMPEGMNLLPGANSLCLYDEYGTIYEAAMSKTLGRYSYTQKGQSVNDGVKEYVQEIIDTENAAGKKKNTDNMWLPDNVKQEETLDYFTLDVVGSPAYMGGSVYEMVHADLGYREAYMLMGMRLDDPEGSWRVFYDSLAGLGSTPEELDFSNVIDTTLAGYKGRLYLIGTVIGAEFDPLEEDESATEKSTDQDNNEDAATDFTEEDVTTNIFSCAPTVEGVEWRKEDASLPAPRAAGYAVAQGGNLYYALSAKSYEDVDYSIYKFDGKSWTVAGTLPKALFLGEKGAQVISDGFLIIITSGYTGIPCAVSIDEKGILFGGMSFDGLGDTFRFNTTTGKAEPIGYTLWSDAADRATSGAAAGSSLWVQYTDETDDKIVARSMPIKTGYVRLARTIDGEGTGIVTGGEYCPKGEATDVTIVPDKGSYIYSISSSGLRPSLNYGEVQKNIAATIKNRQKAVTAKYPATSNGTLDIVFGKISTSIDAEKSMTKAVGNRDLGIFTDGTISDVSLKSSNTKYASINSDGTVKFKKAGIGKTVSITATALDNPSVKATVKVKIVSRTAKKFKLGKYKMTFRTRVLRDLQLGKTYRPSAVKTKATSAGKVKVTWKKAKKSGKLSGYIILRKTGKGRYVQVAKVGKGKTSYTDKKAKKGKTYRYTVVGYTKSGKYIKVSGAAVPSKIKVSK